MRGSQRLSLNPSTTFQGINGIFVLRGPPRTRAMRVPGPQPAFSTGTALLMRPLAFCTHFAGLGARQVSGLRNSQPGAFPMSLSHRGERAVLRHSLVPLAPCALPLRGALTLAPDKHVGLEVCGVCVGDSSQDIVEGGVTDLPGFLCREQPGKKMWSQVVAPGATGWQQEGLAPRTISGTGEAGGFSFLQPQFLCVTGLAEQAACPKGKRHLPILGVFKPKPVAITQAHKLVQDDGTEEGAVSLQHASRDQLQPSCVVGIQGSDILQDLARSAHRTHVSGGNSARATD